MKQKYKCKYCNKMITTDGGMCSCCKNKLALVRKLLLMVKTEAENTKK